MLDLRRLRLLREVDARGTVHGAARALDYTPSAISQQLAVLEREAGIALLERAGRNVRLTEAGRALVRHARRAARRDGGCRGGAGRASPPAGPRASSASRRSSRRSCASSRPPSPRWPRAIPTCASRPLEAEVEDAVPSLRLQQLDAVVGDEYEGQPRAIHRDLVREPLLSEQVRARPPRGASARAPPDRAAGRGSPTPTGPPAIPAPGTARCRSASAAGSAASSPTCATPPTTS